jgi:hypothetical protein
MFAGAIVLHQLLYAGYMRAEGGYGREITVCRISTQACGFFHVMIRSASSSQQRQHASTPGQFISILSRGPEAHWMMHTVA